MPMFSRLICPGAASQFFIAACAIFIIISHTGPAVAEQDSLPAPVDTALREAEAVSDLRVSFTMEFQWMGGLTVVERYDAGRDEWAPVSGDKTALSDNARDNLEKYKQLESAPGGLIYADYRDHLSNVRLTDETADTLTYSFSSPQAPDMDGESPVRTQLIIDKDRQELMLYSVRSLRSFKPGALAKINDLVFRQRFERKIQGAPPLMTHFYWRMKGERMFGAVNKEFSMRFSDFQLEKTGNAQQRLK
ncbi:hypothetical protein [Hyphococcus sp.]|uniref:hypothetical protein n=1 Tax=Hyphococcus sp. TaxID=2038636 RepID=UPI003CCC00FD